ncbi:MAG TPA: outer membrane beta-barrel family protein, partial [Longimicrobium sp.]|nr:outer membrane beta-barrel family protein [Longimicrobium sp.]
DQPLREDNLVESVNRTLTAQLDYTRAFAERTRLETGYKGTLRLLDNETGVDRFDYGTGRWMDVAGRDNAFEYDENVNAGYAVLSQGMGKLDVQAGFRAERTDREFTLANTGEVFPKTYWSFFPSGLVSMNLDERTQVKASYSKRIQRPDTRLLNPFGFYEDQLSRFQGNPELEPEYMHSLELGFQRSFTLGSLQATPFFRRSENAVRRVREMHGDTAVWTFRNLETSDSYGMDLNASLRTGPVNGFMGFSAYRSSSEGTVNGQDIGVDAFGWSIRANATYRVTPRMDVQGMVMYRAPQDVEQGRMSAQRMSAFTLRQKLMGEKANVSLRLVDPFNTMGFTQRTQDGTIFQLNQRRAGARAAYLTFTYNFGQQPKLRPQQQPEQTPDAQMPGTMPGQ